MHLKKPKAAHVVKRGQVFGRQQLAPMAVNSSHPSLHFLKRVKEGAISHERFSCEPMGPDLCIGQLCLEKRYHTP